MDRNEIFDVVKRHTREVVPGLERHDFVNDDALRELGANSIDRSEIIMMTLESLALRVPLVQLAGARSIGELTDLLHGLKARHLG